MSQTKHLKKIEFLNRHSRKNKKIYQVKYKVDIQEDEVGALLLSNCVGREQIGQSPNLREMVKEIVSGSLE